MIRIEFDIDKIDSGDLENGIKHFEMKGTHKKVVEECCIALYSIIYAFKRQYSEIENKTGYVHGLNVGELFKNIIDTVELSAAGFHYDKSTGDLSEDPRDTLDSLFDNCLVFLSESEKEPPEIDKLFMDVRYRKPD